MELPRFAEKFKIFLSPAIALYIFISGISGIPAGAAAQPFADVKRTDWAYADIMKLSEAAIVSGDKIKPKDGAATKAGANSGQAARPAFRPDDTLTREECAVVVARLINIIAEKNASNSDNPAFSASGADRQPGGLTAGGADKQPDGLPAGRSFSDVAESRWSYPYIEAAKPYLTGASGGQRVFLPDSPTLRGDLVSALMRLVQPNRRYINYSILGGFADGGDIPGEWRPHIAAAIENSVLFGDKNRKLRLGEPVTRREACALTVRALKGIVTFPEPEAQKLYVPDLDSGFYDAFFSDAVFVGDSITMGLRNYVLSERAKGASPLGGARFLCVGSYGLRAAAGKFDPGGVNLSYQGVGMPLEDCLAKMEAKDVFIMLGMNDWAGAALPESIIMYGAVLDKIYDKNPNASIYIEFCTPITSEREAEKLNNANMDKFNAAIVGLCEERNIDYVDVSTPMKDENNALKREYASDNYVHMNAPGCKVWIESLRAFAREKYISGLWLPDEGAAPAESYPGLYVDVW